MSDLRIMDFLLDILGRRVSVPFRMCPFWTWVSTLNTVILMWNYCQYSPYNNFYSFLSQLFSQIRRNIQASLLICGAHSWQLAGETYHPWIKGDTWITINIPEYCLCHVGREGIWNMSVIFVKNLAITKFSLKIQGFFVMLCIALYSNV